MSLEKKISEKTRKRTTSSRGSGIRKNRAENAWDGFRSRLPERLPLPKGLLIARVVVVFSIVMFAVFSVIAVWQLQPLRASAHLHAQWFDEVASSRLTLGDALLSENGARPFQAEVYYLDDRLRVLRSEIRDHGRFNPNVVDEVDLVMSALPIAQGNSPNVVPLLSSLKLLEFELRSEELKIRGELDAQSDVLTFSVAGALVLCCVTLLLMEQSNRAKEKVASLRFKATHDPLTRGLNRAAIWSLAEQELTRAKRVGHSLAIFLVDMDHFKEINDQFGHPAGDSVIKQASNRLRRNVRVYDAVGRYGGDEFLIVLPNCDMTEAEVVAERLRESFDLPMDLVNSKKKISICVGGTVFRLGDFTLDELIVRADQSLYRAKEAGRNGWAIMDAPIPALGNEAEEVAGELPEVAAETH